MIKTLVFAGCVIGLILWFVIEAVIDILREADD